MELFMSKPHDKKKVAVFVESELDEMIRSSFVFVLRIKSNLDYLHINNLYDINYININKFKTEDLLENDIFIFYRAQFFLPSIRRIVRFLKSIDKKIIYDIDDYYLDIPSYSFSGHLGYGKRKGYFIDNLNDSDLIVVSTDFLKETLSGYNKNIVVVENTLPEYHFRERSFSGETVRILITSNDNLKIISFKNDFLKCLREIKKIFNNKIELIFLGKFSNVDNLEDIADKFYDRMTPELYRDYLNNNSINIGLVPLGGEEDPVTLLSHSCKSNIKFLEFADFGIAGIYSDVEPYKSLGSRKGGIVVENNYDHWLNAIRKLINSQELCSEIIENSRAIVREKYMKDHSQEKFLKVLNSLAVSENGKLNVSYKVFISYLLIVLYKKDILIQRLNFIIFLLRSKKYKEIYARIKGLV